MAGPKTLKVSVVADARGAQAGIAHTGAALTGLERASASLSRAGAGLTKGVTLPLLAIGGAAFAAANEYDKATATIRTGTGATGKALDELTESFKKVNTSVPGATADVASALADLNTRTGATGKELEQLTTQMLNLGRITGEDTAALIASGTRVFGDWNIAADKQADTLDYLFKVAQSTGIGVNALNEKIVQFGAPLRQMGFGFEQSAAMLGKWEKEGVNAEKILSGLAIGMGKAARAGKEPAEAFREMEKAVKGAATEAEAQVAAMDLFGAKAGPEMATAIREGRLGVDELMAQLEGSSETINKAATDSLTFGDRMEVMKKKAMDAAVPLGEKLLPAVEGMIPALTAVIGWIASLAAWFGGLSEGTQKTILVFAGLAAAAGPITSGIGKAVAGYNRLSKAFKAIGASKAVGAMRNMGTATANASRKAAVATGRWIKNTAALIANKTAVIAKTVADKAAAVATAAWSTVQMAFNAIMALNPVALVVLAIVALVAIVVVCWNKFEGFRSFVSGVWEWIANAASVAWNFIKDAVLTAVSLVWGWVQTYIGYVAGAWQWISDAVSSVWNWIKEAVSLAVAIVWERVRDAVAKAAGIWQSVADKAGEVWEAVKKTVETAKTKIGDIVENIKKGFSGMWEGLKDGLVSTVNWVIGKLNSLIDKINKIPGVDIGKIPTIGGYAATGYSNGITSYAAAAPPAWSRRAAAHNAPVIVSVYTRDEALAQFIDVRVENGQHRLARRLVARP